MQYAQLAEFEKLLAKDNQNQEPFNEQESRITVSIAPTDTHPKILRGMPRKTEELLLLILMLPQLTLEYQLQVRLSLETELERRNRPLEDRILLQSSYRNSLSLKLWFLEQNDRYVFGILRRTAKCVAKKLRLIKDVPQKVKRPERQRGYRDHGTLLPSHKWLPKSDFSFTEQQQEIELDDHIAEVLSYSELLSIGNQGVNLLDQGSASSAEQKPIRPSWEEFFGEKEADKASFTQLRETSQTTRLSAFGQQKGGDS